LRRIRFSSHVDGEAGRLIVSGFDLEALVERFGFEDATGLLWRAFHDREWPED
jgi:citrate synthase